MKKIVIIFVVAVFISLDVIRTFAQAPQSFNYQAIARDISGNILANQNVSFKIIILKTSTAGTVVYSETHSIITNQFGLVNLQIGNGTVVSGDLSTIDWGTDIYFIRIEMDAAGGTNYQLMGTSQLLSVPYALYAQSAGGSIDYDTDSTNELQTLSVNGNNLTISNGNTVILTDNVNDADADSTNELQALSISNDTIYLSNGGFVKLPGGSVDADADSTNELQTISKTGNTITLSKGGGAVTDDVNDADADSTNELQALSISNDTIFLTNGGFVILPAPVTETDPIYDSSVASGITGADTTNWNNKLDTEVDSSVTNELQLLSISNDTIYLSSGGFVTLPADQTTDADADSTNELQTLSISNDTLSLSSGGSVVLPYDIIPVGSIMPFAGSTAPSGWLLCDGSQISRTTYAILFTAIGTNWGIGDGTTTFHLPDFRGRFLRGVDAGAGRDPDAATRTVSNVSGNTGDNVGSVQNDNLKSHNHIFTGNPFTRGNGNTGSIKDVTSEGQNPIADITPSGTISNTGGNETRPVNAYVNFIIKY